MKRWIYAFLIIPIIGTSHADLGEAWRILRNSQGSTNQYPMIVRQLVGNKLYYASIPYIKEYLTTSNGVGSVEIDDLIDEVVSRVGVRQFEVMPNRFLSNSKAPMLQYILAKKFFREKKYDEALNILRTSIPRNHPAKPFSLSLEAGIYSITKRYNDAERVYQDCLNVSKSAMGRTKDPTRQRQLTVNRDYCIVGVSRTQFAAGEYGKANMSYLDTPTKQ